MPIFAERHFTGKGEQIIVRSLSGAAQEMQVRIIDAALPNAVQEIYTGSDNMGAALTLRLSPVLKRNLFLKILKTAYVRKPLNTAYCRMKKTTILTAGCMTETEIC